MIQVRDTFQIKFGKIDQAVEWFKRLPEDVLAWPQGKGQYEILTDLSGDMYTLVSAVHLDSIGLWETTTAQLYARAEFQEWYKSFKQYVADGQRRFYSVEQGNAGWSRQGAVVVRSCFRALEWRVHEAVDLLASYGAMLVDCGVGDRPRILTDFSGPMFNVIIEVETLDLKVWDEHRRSMFLDPQFQVWFMKLLTCVSHGSRDFYSVALH